MISIRSTGFLAAGGLLAYSLLPSAQGKSAPAPDLYPKTIAPMIKRYCAPCHGKKDPPGGVTVLGFPTTASVVKGQAVWSRILEQIRAGAMPPQGSKQPTKSERQQLVNWIETTLSGDCKLADPGRVTIRRLNRAEYNNTVRDLLGVEFKPADDFPSDDVGNGFDNMGDVLSISPLLMEKYLAAAEQLAERSIQVPDKAATRYENEKLDAEESATAEEQGDWLLYSAGTVFAFHNFPRDGVYTLKVGAYGQQAGPEKTQMAITLDGKQLEKMTVAATVAAPSTYSVPVTVSKGKHKVGARFLNDYYEPNKPPPIDRNLVIQFIEVSNPLKGDANISDFQRRMVPSEPIKSERVAAARKALTWFASRAYRRPATKDEIDRLMKVYAVGSAQDDSYERGLQLATEAVLCSPNFLFRVELDPKNTSKEPRLLNSYEMASRLSYFLWSSMPDDQLMNLATTNKLQDPSVIKQQVQRMLKDPKSRALTDNFAEQWLNLRILSIAQPDPKLFPDFNEGLRDAMETETKMFFESVLRENKSILDFLDGRYTYLNGDLAKHYGISGVQGDEFRRVALPDGRRGGIITQGSILTLTSNPTRTSPVKRGKWVLDQILGTPPPPPPPGAGTLPDNVGIVDGPTVRERLKQHTQNPSCAGCHRKLDPIGFGLENFDAVGAWRTTEGKALIDSTGIMPDGSKFSGPEGLRQLISNQKDKFVRCLSEKMLTYAIGRGVDASDKCAVDDVAKATAKQGYRMSALIESVVLSDPFRKQSKTRK